MKNPRKSVQSRSMLITRPCQKTFLQWWIIYLLFIFCDTMFWSYILVEHFKDLPVNQEDTSDWASCYKALHMHKRVDYHCVDNLRMKFQGKTYCWKKHTLQWRQPLLHLPIEQYSDQLQQQYHRQNWSCWSYSTGQGKCCVEVRLNHISVNSIQ